MDNNPQQQCITTGLLKLFKFKLYKSVAVCLLLLLSKPLLAGGPLIIEGTNGSTPVTYKNPNITLHIESGNLGIRTNTDASALLEEAFNLWNNVDTSSIQLNIDQTQINTDINIDNYDSYIPSADGTKFNTSDNLNPVVYDNNGEIIDLLLGIGQSDNTIGLAASIYSSGSNYFLEGYVILNGKDLGQTDAVVKLLISHEIGHFFGLDHSQTNIDNQENIFGFPGICTTATDYDSYPVMYPFICRDSISLHSDDISAVSGLYPATTINNKLGILQGHFVDEAGKAILGANLWLENIVSGETYSIVSDYLQQKNGFYKIYLPTGRYTLHANSVNSIFTGGSGIGPYSEDTFDASFTSPHPITAITVQNETTGNEQVIDVTAGQTTDINFDINGKQVSASFLASNNDSKGANSPFTLLLLLFVLITSRWRMK